MADIRVGHCIGVIAGSASTVTGPGPDGADGNAAINVNEVARVNTTGGPVSVTLPPAFNNRGLSVIVKDVGGAAAVNVITVLPAGANTIDGGGSAAVSIDRGSLTLVSDGVSEWMIV